MDELTKELVALGAAVASSGHGCIDQHIARCDQLEVARQEVVEAIEIGLKVRQGGNQAIQKHVQDLLCDYPQEAA